MTPEEHRDVLYLAAAQLEETAYQMHPHQRGSGGWVEGQRQALLGIVVNLRTKAQEIK